MTADPDEFVIGAFRKNAKEEVRARLVTFHGRRCLDIRVYATDGAEPVPTKKGVAIAIDKIHRPSPPA